MQKLQVLASSRRDTRRTVDVDDDGCVFSMVSLTQPST